MRKSDRQGEFHSFRAQPACWATPWAALVVCLMGTIPSSAQTFTSIYSFDGTDGNGPRAGLVQATNGNLYGTTRAGGLRSLGTAFGISPTGTPTGVVSFCPRPHFGCGTEPVAGLIQALDGNFYGTALYGGSKGKGAVVKLTPEGDLTTLYPFDGSDGINPEAALIQGTDANLYGTTAGGGRRACGTSYGCGTIFKMATDGTLTTLYKFCSQTNCTDGANPVAGVVQGTDGDFYGTTEYGGSNDAGTVFKITSTGALTTLYSFCSQPNCTDGAGPLATLVQAADGDFYGTTNAGGVSGNCQPYSSCGTIFKITPSGTLTTLYSFCPLNGCPDGATPLAGLIQASDGNLYGTTSQGGSNNNCSGQTGCGTVFGITPSGTLTTLYSFCPQSGCPDGWAPSTSLVQDTNGTLYGITPIGGASGPYGYGTVFSLSISLGPFVETQPTSAGVGTPINILGTSLNGATAVTFNGTAATFTVSSNSLIRSYVPDGATTGPVQVVTSGGTLTSNVPFRVIP